MRYLKWDHDVYRCNVVEVYSVSGRGDCAAIVKTSSTLLLLRESDLADDFPLAKCLYYLR